MSAFMAQTGRLVVLRRCRRRAGRLDLRGPASTCAARSRAWAPTASRRSCATSTSTSCANCSSAPASTASIRGEFRRYGSARKLYNFHVDNAGSVLMSRGIAATACASRALLSTAHASHEIQRAAAKGIYDIRGFGAKRKRAALRRPAVPRRERVALSAGGLSREVRHRRHARHALRQEADRAEDPDHHCRHELRCALGAGQGGARPRRAPRSGTSTTTGDGGMTPEERGHSETLVYQLLPCATA